MTKYLPTGKGAEAVYSANAKWHAYVNGVMLRKSNGVGKSFKTEAAAMAAALKHKPE